MNDLSCDLLLPNGSRSNRVKSGTCGVCLVRTFHPGIVPARGSKAPDAAPNRSTGPFGTSSLFAQALFPSQTDSSEPIAFGYFPL